MLKINALANVLFLCSCCWLMSCGLNKTPKTSSPNPTSDATVVPKRSIVQKIKERGHLPVSERIAWYHQLKKESPGEYNFENEDELTMYGYSMLWENKVVEAIEIFKLIASEFPHSANAYDSLGEAYLKNGDKELSLANYEKSLAMNPDNFNAEDQIERIKHPEKPVEKLTDKFFKVFTKNEYREDLDQLGKTLLKVHPNALKFISEKDFWKVVEQKKSLISDGTTFGEFAWHCSEVISSVHCSHTDMGDFNVEDKMLPLRSRFPLLTRWVNDQLFVIDPMNNAGSVHIKDEILSINGVAAPKLIADIYPHISAQGYIQTTKKHFFNNWSTGLIAFALGFPETYSIVLKGQKAPILLNKAETKKDPFWDPSIFYCQKELCLEFLDDQKTAVMSISTFNFYPFNNLDVFKTFVDKSMTEINSKGIKNLIIDVRWNGGGSQLASIHLLRYLAKKPFVYYSRADFAGKTGKIEGEESFAPFENRYKGKLYFMMDGVGNSTTGHFMSLVKVLNMGTIVGEELGSNQFCSAGQKICRLKNTKLEFYVANNTHVSSATSLPDETGILPDYTVTQSIDDYLKKIDTVREFTIHLAKKQP